MARPRPIELAAAPPLPPLLEAAEAEILSRLAPFGRPELRLRQIRRWFLTGRAQSFADMTDVPRELRASLAASVDLFSTRVARHLQAPDRTHKLLLRLRDSQLVECVLIQEDNRRTACISTQVGCGMACVFCASGLNGLERNLTAGEITEQLVRLRNLLPPGQRLTHVVVMGMGEPLANLDNLLRALAVAGSKRGLGIGARHITISTVGLPDKIRRLAGAGEQYHLAVSLHAPNDVLRNQIVPTNEKVGLAAILAAADEYFERTGRQVTYEYVLLGGINDAAEQARELVRLLEGRRAHVNLIPFNDVQGLPYRRPSSESLHAFVRILREGGLSVKVRKRKGSAIDAACGQLRRQAVAAGRPAATPAGPDAFEDPNGPLP